MLLHSFHTSEITSLSHRVINRVVAETHISQYTASSPKYLCRVVTFLCKSQLYNILLYNKQIKERRVVYLNYIFNIFEKHCKITDLQVQTLLHTSKIDLIV